MNASRVSRLPVQFSVPVWFGWSASAFQLIPDGVLKSVRSANRLNSCEAMVQHAVRANCIAELHAIHPAGTGDQHV